MNYSKMNQKQIIEEFTRADYKLLEEISRNEKVYYLLRKWNATPSCNWRNVENLVLQARKKITIRE